MDTDTRARLLRARQARLRNAEHARQVERSAALGPESLRAERLEVAADYRATAAEWSKVVEELEAEHGLTRRQCADPTCPKRAGDGDPFCAEHDDAPLAVAR